MLRQIFAASSKNDIIWEPFGGMATASVAAIELERQPFVAEMNNKFQQYAEDRLKEAVSARNEGRHAKRKDIIKLVEKIRRERGIAASDESVELELYEKIERIIFLLQQSD